MLGIWKEVWKKRGGQAQSHQSIIIIIIIIISCKSAISFVHADEFLVGF